jgi:uncharacterized protein YndB with AHSA1/START domain
MSSIKHLYHINASPEKVFEALTTIQGLSGWWTTKTSGDCLPGGTIQFNFGDMGGPEMKVREMIPHEKLTWECLNMDWAGHLFTFQLDTNDNKTRVRFEHSGWNETGDFYASCCYSWARYLESLRQLCQTGRGEAFGSEGYRK